MKIPASAHGILSHYFHEGEARPQGSLTAAEWEAGLDAYGSRLVPAAEWIERALAGTGKDEVCISFDDGLREAYTIALPVLEQRGLTAAWNIYTSPLVGVPNNLERWRWVRNFGLGGMEPFYSAWREWAKPFVFPETYLADRSYLSREDRVFRYWRNCVASPSDYEKAMMAVQAGCHTKWDASQHWLSFIDIQVLHRTGHVIGFHTHSHPTNMARLSVEQQALEYATSKGILEFCLERPVNTGAHPCDSWTPEGIEWLKNNGVRLMWGGTMNGSLPWHAPRWSTGNWNL